MSDQGRVPLQDLERGKFTDDSTKTFASVRVRDDHHLEPFHEFLVESGGSKDQTINGSVTPVDFEYTFSEGAILTTITLIMSEKNIGSLLDYGSIAGGLTNGIRISHVDPDGTESVYGSIKRNVDFGHLGLTGQSVVSLVGNTNEDVFAMDLRFSDGFILEAGSIVRIRIQDDLTTIDYQEASIVFRRDIHVNGP